MDDLSNLSTALQEILAAPEGSETLASTIEGYFLSSDIVTKKAVCETLLDILNDGDAEHRAKQRDITLKETSLTYLPHLLPLSSSVPAAEEIVLLIAEHGNPREVVLGLSEGIQSIVDRAEGYQVSDNSDGGAFEDENEDDGNMDIDWPQLLEEYQVILRCFIIATPRLTNSKSTPTLLSLSESISNSLPVLAHQATTSSSRTLLRLLCELVEVVWGWVQKTIDSGREQRAILSNMLFESITLLGHKVNARLTERWFLRTFPKFQSMPTSQAIVEVGIEGFKGGQEVLDLAWATAKKLDYTPADLIRKIVEPSHLSIHASLASLNLLASQLAKNDLRQALSGTEVSPTLLDDGMPILCAALSGSSVDAGIAYTWASVHHYSMNTDDSVEYDNASMLLELLVPLTAQHPSALTRLALFKLIGSIISLLTTPNDKIQLFKQLLEPANPFDNIRIQSLSLLRESISSKSKTVLSPLLAEVIFPVLFVFPEECDPEENPFYLTAPEMLESYWVSWWTECLALLWFILDSDKGDLTTIRTNPKHDERVKGWIKAVEGKLKEIQGFISTIGNDGDQQEDEFSGVRFMVMRFEDALNRVKGLL
ncbi:uncharacterized protein I303_108587 [Kwoniella dejecticola CBS 10117]|uniref:Uncharacterized protein n=1 Tax=Kwoniella dejecticola CBS 10117 TaxID=1296121 RepID=A0A1A5ZWZ9_9TREE|nr:uncharacterized protein I303_07088 [Kwoniella dejecticola CBS 10117]OBR82329.1 hypothetical protein I303_07088 [Kwoniella dejecticola CBS 10117]